MINVFTGESCPAGTIQSQCLSLIQPTHEGLLWTDCSGSGPGQWKRYTTWIRASKPGQKNLDVFSGVAAIVVDCVCVCVCAHECVCGYMLECYRSVLTGGKYVYFFRMVESTSSLHPKFILSSEITFDLSLCLYGGKLAQFN